MVKLSDYVFQFLKKRGINYIFMLPGGGAMHLDDSLGKSGIEYICFLHEQAASIAAEAYGQHTNTPGVVLVTSGPGATNAITGVTAGWIDSTPMIIISGQAKRTDLIGDRNVRQIGSQEVQIIPMVKPITKYAVQILNPEEIRYHLEKAYIEAITGRPGPVWLDIPLDVQATMIQEDALDRYIPKPAKEPELEVAINKTLELLQCAKKPLILAGNGIKLSDAAEDMYEIMNLLQLPVETTWKCIDMVEESDPLYVGHPGIMGDRGANLILQTADFILSVGCRMDTSITAFNDRNFGKCAQKVVVDIDPNEIERMNVEKGATAVCDAGWFLRLLVKKIKENKQKLWTEEIQLQRQKWLFYCRNLRQKHPVIKEEHKLVRGYVSAYYFIGELCKLLRFDDVIVPESSGGAGEITYQAFRLKKGQKMKNAAGLGSMGFGLPYAIGSCVANNRRRTILINGDGSFQLNIQELETLHRLKLPVKIFIWNNGGYASIRSMQRNNFESHYVGSNEESGMTMPNISRIAEAYGFMTYQIRDNEELDKLLPQIMADDMPMLCELMVLPEETVSPRVKAIIGENGNMISGSLEDMWPQI